ncbi:MAG TPA: lysine--tRNA ligase [bacterium]
METGDNDLIAQRKKKLAEIRALGVDPYPHRYAPTDSAAALQAAGAGLDQAALEALGRRARIAGRIVALRSFGKAVFAHLLDATGTIQVYFRKDALPEATFEVVKRLDVGDIVGLAGTLFRTKTGELTVQAAEATLLTKSLRPLPEKWHGLTDVEARYRQRYLDLIANPEVRGVFRVRAAIVAGIRAFFGARGFLEVETPMMQAIPGGAAARPFRTFYNALDCEMFLRVAPELYLKRLVVGGFERVFEINRNFRNEGLSRSHNPEFTMLEFYAAYMDYSSLMDLTEELFVGLAREVRGTTVLTYQGQEVDLTPPWPRLRLVDSLWERGGLAREQALDFEFLKAECLRRGVPVKTGYGIGRLQLELFERLVEPGLVRPTFVTDFPKEVSPLAKSLPDQPELVERFELFVAGRELANAFTELNDPIDQRERLAAQALERAGGDEEAMRMDEDFLAAIEHGLPPTGGEGIGIDRLVMLFTDMPNIRDVILFPQLRPEKTEA